jgi:hypothetical protein
MAGILYNLGYDLGRSAEIEPDKNNVKALFENTIVTNFNEVMLSSLGGSWTEPPDKLKNLDAPSFLVSRVKILLEAEYGKRDLVCIKDPRLCLLLDSYLESIKQLNWSVRVIRMERPRAEVEASLRMVKARGGGDHFGQLYDFYHERLNWIIQKRMPTVHTFNYRDVIDNPLKQAKNIVSLLGQNIDVDAHAKKVVEFVDPNLKHH